MCIFRFQDPELERSFYREIFGLDLDTDDSKADLHRINGHAASENVQAFVAGSVRTPADQTWETGVSAR